jgi:hypothetical protein
MIEASIITALKADAVLTTYVSTYGGSPAIFSEEAPEDANDPYITISLRRNASEDDSVIQIFNLYVDYWDNSISRANSRAAAERIEFVLDHNTFDDSRYSGARCRFFSAGPVDEEDPRAIHHNLQFTIRAARKKWMQQL